MLTAELLAAQQVSHAPSQLAQLLVGPRRQRAINGHAKTFSFFLLPGGPKAQALGGRRQRQPELQCEMRGSRQAAVDRIGLTPQGR
jgi:hypothetical protein